MQKIMLVLLVGCGGFIGAALRYVISLGATRAFGVHFPYGTFIANILGAVIIGFVMQLSLNPSIVSPNSKLFLTTGMMGGLTTFSTFSYETIGLLNSGRIGVGVINIGANLGFSLVGVVVGMSIAKLIMA